MTITAFLLARIEEDEAVALAASEGRHWEWADNGEDLMSDFQGELYSWGTPREECIIATEGANPPEQETAGAHIARHDPARVLAECKAKRAIVEMHPIITGPRILAVDSSGTDFGCETCHCVDKVAADGIVEAVGYCDTLRALATPYADHADYRAEWAL